MRRFALGIAAFGGICSATSVAGATTRLSLTEKAERVSFQAEAVTFEPIACTATRTEGGDLLVETSGPLPRAPSAVDVVVDPRTGRCAVLPADDLRILKSEDIVDLDTEDDRKKAEAGDVEDAVQTLPGDESGSDDDPRDEVERVPMRSLPVRPGTTSQGFAQANPSPPEGAPVHSARVGLETLDPPLALGALVASPGYLARTEVRLGWTSDRTGSPAWVSSRYGWTAGQNGIGTTWLIDLMRAGPVTYEGGGVGGPAVCDRAMGVYHNDDFALSLGNRVRVIHHVKVCGRGDGTGYYEARHVASGAATHHLLTWRLTFD